MKLTFVLSVLFFLAFMSGCKHVVEYDCTGVTPTYTQHVKPILDVTCAGSECHTNGQAEGGIDLLTYAGASSASKKKSFMGTIQHMPFYPKMPKDADRLPDAQIHIISCWIENGSPE